MPSLSNTQMLEGNYTMEGLAVNQQGPASYQE